MARQKRKKYSCDFETTTKEEDCRVWAYGWMEIGKKKNYKIGNSLDEFMEFVKSSLADLYFHNLKFDGSFIVNWLLHNVQTQIPCKQQTYEKNRLLALLINH